MNVQSFLLFVLLTVTCPALLQAQSRKGGLESSGCNCNSSASSEVEELKSITFTLLKEFVNFSALVKADLTTVKTNLTSLWSELGQVAKTVVDSKPGTVTNKREVNRQDVVSESFQRQLDSIQAAERDILDQGKLMFNKTRAFVSHLVDQQLESMEVVKRDVLDQGQQLSAVSALVRQLADCQYTLYRNLSNEVSAVCAAEKNDPPTQTYTTELPASTEIPSSTTPLSTSTTESSVSTIEPRDTESPTEESNFCGGTLGWKRVAFLNMTDPTHQCPSGWQLTNYSKRTCGRYTISSNTCDSATFSTGEMNYSRVCGKILAYQFGELTAFYTSSMSIERHYVNGVSLTHGHPRKHIWTFAGGVAESGIGYGAFKCPCDGGTRPVPDFVSNDYFCESGVNGPRRGVFVLHPEDPLWDGQNCVAASSCCEDTLPYFVKELGGLITDDIEARICSYHSLVYSDIAIELLELYVQ